MLGRKKAKELAKWRAAARIQAGVRMMGNPQMWKAMKTGVLVAQEKFRQRAAAMQMKKLKQEAKEVGALVAKIQKTQEQMNDLRKRSCCHEEEPVILSALWIQL